ncbi:hypothetical protein [Streptomyces sp. NPDC101237]|uniref:hypothetical protein n=1 Tax=Streptomyces sp. NPDC101237 TaxID=3366139 RepID=UPI0037F93945
MSRSGTASCPRPRARAATCAGLDFARRYGFGPARPVRWEVEVLEPAELQRLVLAAVDP